jgi:hypothetical protein
MSEATEIQSGRDVWMLERKLSRAVFAIGLAVCAFLALRSPDRAVPLWPLLGFLGAYCAVKLLVLVLSLRAHSPLWTANLAEIGALGVLGYVLWAGLKGWSVATMLSLIAIGAMLMVGGVLRRRAAQSLETRS